MTYQETVLPFRILRHDELPEEHKQAFRDSGIDPDTRWSLIYSFETMADAEEALAQENETKAPWETYKIVEGEQTTIERSVI